MFSRKCLCKYGILAAFVGAIAFLFTRDFVLNGIVKMKDWFVSIGGAGVILYMIVFYLWALVFLPTSAIEVLGGFIFKWWGLLIVLTPKSLAAITSFYLARYSEQCRTMLPEDSIILGLRDALRENPWKVNAMVRGAFMPFWLKNYGMGAIPETKVLHFVCCQLSLGFCLTFVSVYIGLTGDDLIAVLKHEKAFTPGQYVAFAVVGLFSMAFIVVIFFYARKINKQLGEQTDVDYLLPLDEQPSPPTLVKDVTADQ